MSLQDPHTDRQPGRLALPSSHVCSVADQREMSHLVTAEVSANPGFALGPDNQRTWVVDGTESVICSPAIAPTLLSSSLLVP